MYFGFLIDRSTWRRKRDGFPWVLLGSAQRGTACVSNEFGWWHSSLGHQACGRTPSTHRSDPLRFACSKSSCAGQDAQESFRALGIRVLSIHQGMNLLVPFCLLMPVVGCNPEIRDFLRSLQMSTKSRWASSTRMFRKYVQVVEETPSPFEKSLVHFRQTPPSWDVPLVQVVREKLCELEIPHKFISSARGSPKVCAQGGVCHCQMLFNVIRVALKCHSTFESQGLGFPNSNEERLGCVCMLNVYVWEFEQRFDKNMGIAS